MIGLRRWVIAVTRIGMLNSSSATWPCDSPNGASGSTYSVSIRPSMTTSASAGTRRSTVRARTTLIAPPASPPATGAPSTPVGPACAPLEAARAPRRAARPHAPAGPVDRAVGRDRADDDRDRIFPAAAVDHVGEQEGLPVLLGQAADELPAHQRMQLGVLVDRAIDRDEQALALQRLEVLMEIGVA